MKKIPETKKPQIAIYQTLGDEQKIRVRIEDENVWLTQKLIAELFNVDVRTVNEHLKNIFLEQELDENSVIRNFRITANDSKTYDTKHYNLDVILAVGYRVRSDRGTQFRQWATERLREYLVIAEPKDKSHYRHKNTPTKKGCFYYFLSLPRRGLGEVYIFTKPLLWPLWRL